MRGVLNDALSIYFAGATLASAFVAGHDCDCRGDADRCGTLRLRRGVNRRTLLAWLHSRSRIEIFAQWISFAPY
jgi:hypothetical protein